MELKNKFRLQTELLGLLLLLTLPVGITAQNNLISNTQDCSASRPPFAFDIQRKWVTTTSNKVWTCTTPLAGDIDGDGKAELFALTSDDCIYIFEGETGSQIGSICPGVVLANWAWTGTTFCLLDGDKNGKGEVFIAAESGNIYLYEVSSSPGVRPITFTQKWVMPGYLGRTCPVVADLDGDAVPEFVAGNMVFDYNGNLKATLAYRANAGNFGLVGLPLVVDLDNNGIPEIVVGTNVYKYNGTTAVLWATAPNIPNQEGCNMAADIDQDGNIDLVFHSTYNASPAFVKVWTPATRQDLGNLPFTPPSTTQRSIPFIGDIDGIVTNGKKYPEICINTAISSTGSRGTLYAFSYTGSGFVQKWAMPHSDGSGGTILTLFDFNNDGIVELVYRDETDIHIFDGSGSTPISVFSYQCGSETASEQPIVVDALGTGSANIVVTGSATPRGGYGEVMLFEGANSKWMSCPKVWNQQLYSNLLVNNDLTIPDTIKPINLTFNQTCPGGTTVQYYNGGPMQAPYISDATYCPIDLSPDVYIVSGSITLLSSSSVEISVVVGNQGLAVAPASTPIRYYQNSIASGNILSSVNTTLGINLYPGQTTTITQTISGLSPMPTMFYVRLLDDGTNFPATGAFSDCNLTNNPKSFGTFELLKTANSLSSCIDGITTFTLKLINNSNQLQQPTTYNNIVITDSLGVGWEFISATPLQGNVTPYNTTTHKLEWKIPTLAPQDTAQLVMVAKAQTSGSLRNISWVDTVNTAVIGKEFVEAYVIVSVDTADIAPIISPSNPVLCIGDGSLTLTAMGAIGATSYQWYEDNIEIVGETANTYTATTVGNYSVASFNGNCFSQRSDEVSITVSPKPSIKNKTTTICSGSTFTITPSNNLAAGDTVPTGTTYTWTVSSNANITGATNQSTPQTSISQTLTNTSSLTQNVIYTVTATSGSCTSTFTITVTVNNFPSLNTDITGPHAVCVGNTIQLTNATNGGVWTVNNSNAAIANPNVNPEAVTGAAAGNSYVTYTLSNGQCETKKTFLLKVVPATAPTIKIGFE